MYLKSKRYFGLYKKAAKGLFLFSVVFLGSVFKLFDTST